MTEGDDFIDTPAVFAFEGFDEADAFFEFGEASGIEVHFFCIILERLGEVFEFGGGAEVGFGEAGGAWIDAFEVADEATDVADALEDGVVGLAELSDDLGGKFEESSAIGSERVAGEEVVFFAGAEGCGIDFGDLMAEEIEFAFERGLAGGEIGVGGG